MAEQLTTDRVRSYSSGVLGRSLNQARAQHFVIDSSSGTLDGPPEALTTIEAFLSGISGCAVTLIEKQAHQEGLPLERMEVTIEANRTKEDPASFHSIVLHVEMAEVDQQQAESLIETYRKR
jgi:uncharacterized OsmC-like protein